VPSALETDLLENHTIARIAGIPIRANLLLGYLLAIWAIMGAAGGQAEFTITLIVMSTVLLLLHELGHAFMARRFGLVVEDIVLWPLGGMARIREMPDNPRIEAWVAAAGPLVNLTLAAVALPVALLAGGEPSGELRIAAIHVPMSAGIGGLATLFVAINLCYGLFNLIPAFPMDGGRILRAFMGRGDRSWVTATDQATRIGSIIAWSIIIVSLLGGAGFLSLIGFFVLWAGLRERWSVRLRHRAEAFGGAQGRFAGWEHLMRQRGAGAGTNGQAPSDGPAPPGTRRPLAQPSRPQGDGFSDEDIERMETFRGRLQKPNADEGT